MRESNFSIDMVMPEQTVLDLEHGGYHLFGFKAVTTSSPNGSPVVWIKSQKYSTHTTIKWSEHFQAYASVSDIQPGYEITGRNAKDIILGQKFIVYSRNAIGRVEGGGTPGVISTINETNERFATGISQAQPGQDPAPLCAVDLRGLHSVAFAPKERVLLSFATNPFKVGTVTVQMFGPGALIDMGLEDNRRVAFDMDKGWSAEGNPPWLQLVKSGDLITPLLITHSMELAAQVEEIKLLP
ncbi:hypothetical protein IPZ58_06950 [Streptomyces roseoverticillatus]|uniref:hypothetical protein n=1 Tax=Streptomyces roseoverticillatus TaxID=66429 RepID=UPI001F2005C2|nr:hypothetical protein [Streptomyces roseoverticillatus]MCF3101315.1 hypothetical protein [Streptomyces roseoverticillatus]